MVKKKNTKRTEASNKRNVLIFAIVVIVGVLIAAFFINKHIEKQKAAYLIQPKCEVVKQDQIGFTASNGEKLFQDKVNNYSLDVSNFPEITLSTDPICLGTGYEFDLYNRVGEEDRSIARVSFGLPVIEIPRGSNLEDIAKNDYNYIQGEHVDPNGATNYGNPFNSTALVSESLPNGVRVLSWENIYTTKNTHVEGTTASKDYLIAADGKAYYFTLFSWDIPAFNQAVTEFDKTIKTFKSLN